MSQIQRGNQKMKRTVCQILWDKYQIKAKPGLKIKCPFCSKSPFVVRDDNSIGRCYECNKFIIAEIHEPQYYKEFNAVLTNILYDWQAELLAQNNNNNQQARDFLIWIGELLRIL